MSLISSIANTCAFSKRKTSPHPSASDAIYASSPMGILKSRLKDLEISFEYQCPAYDPYAEDSDPDSLERSFSSFSCAAISANQTLATSEIEGDSSSERRCSLVDSPKEMVHARLEDDIAVISGVQTAGGPAGEDRVQAVCCEENDWLFCGIYDGFNGRDAADYLASNLFPKISQNLKLSQVDDGPNSLKLSPRAVNFRVEDCLRKAVRDTEAEYLCVVAKEMADNQKFDLAMVGCCLVSVLLRGDYLYAINLGDSRAVLATQKVTAGSRKSKKLQAVQLTRDHTVKDLSELQRIQNEHPGEEIVKKSRLKGKVTVTRAIGAGYLKHAHFNEKLPFMMKVKDFQGPSYLSSEAHVVSRKVLEEDSFLVIGSDGLFDFFTNEQLVEFVSEFLKQRKGSDATAVAMVLIEECLSRAAKKKGITVEQLKQISSGEERRRFHDDVTVVFILLNKSGMKTSTASMTC